MEHTSTSDLRQFLHACEKGDVEWVEQALESGLIQVDDCDEQGVTGLQMAAAHGHEELARVLVMRGAALEKSNSFGWTPLLHAARHGHEGVVALLLQRNADINQRSVMGVNALTCAVKGGHTKVANRLIDKGIKFDTIASPCELSAMFVASLLGHDQIVRLLTDRGWEIDQRMQSTFMTPLMCAAINGHMTTAQILMERGCDPNITDINDKTALQLSSDRGKREVMGFLDRKTTNKLNAVKEEDNKLGVLEATRSGDVERVKEILLMDNSQKDFFLPQEGATPLMYAAMSGHDSIVVLLVENGCDIDKQDKISGWTALMQAVFHGNKQLAKYLISCGADVTLAAKNGITAFDMASFIDDVDKDLLRLLAAKAMNNKPNGKQDSLKRSSSKSTLNGSDILLEHGSKRWWSKFSSHFKKPFKRESEKNSRNKNDAKFSRVNSTSTMNLTLNRDFPDISKDITSMSFMDRKKSASLLHLNRLTPHTTATLPLGLGGAGAIGSDTLKPILPPFLPQPSFDLASETWGIPANRKSQNKLVLIGNNKHPMVRPSNGRVHDLSSPTSEANYSFGNPSPSSSGGASSISAVFSAPTSGSSATSSTLTPHNVERFHRRAHDYDSPFTKPPSFLLNSHYKHQSMPKLNAYSGISPTNSANMASKRTYRLNSKHRTATSPNFNIRSKSLSDSGTSGSNSEFLSLSSSGQGVIHEHEAEHELESDDLGSVLKNLSLEKYQPIFEKEEIDMEAFLMLNETDLFELGIAHEDSRNQILSAISDLSSAKHVQRHRNDISNNMEASIRVRDSMHSDSTDLDEWYLHEQAKIES